MLDKFLQDNFIFICGKDQIGCDLFQVRIEEKQSYVMSAYEDYIAINSLGFIKYDITELTDGNYQNESDGIYVKKEYFNFNQIPSLMTINTINDLITNKNTACIGYSDNIIKPIYFYDFNKELGYDYVDVNKVKSIKDTFNNTNYDTVICNATHRLKHHMNILENITSKQIIITKVPLWSLVILSKKYKIEYGKMNNYYYIKLGTNIINNITYYDIYSFLQTKPKKIVNNEQQLKIFYHICAINNWKDILRRQIDTIIKVPYHKLYIFAICEENEVYNYIKELYNIDFIYYDTTDNEKESFTIRNIRYFVNDNDVVFYLHNKGVTRYKTNQLEIFKVVYTIPDLYENVVKWCVFMEYALFINYKYCIEKLKDFDVISLNCVKYPPHFAGNFWIARGSLLKNIPEHTADERYLFRIPFKYHSVADINNENGWDLYFNSAPDPVDFFDIEITD
jgi:hypothetical protein